MGQNGANDPTGIVSTVRDKLTEVEFKRARHVISEISRTEQAVKALRLGEYETFGQLMNESHESLK